MPDEPEAPESIPVGDPGIDVLNTIQWRVLWLATRMIDAANRRPNNDGIKVGGHQASSASMVTAMTALYFGHLGSQDRVAVKPHAAPVFHAISYLLGNLDRSYLTMLRQEGGLQAYPSRTKDPDDVDFSTGSVGLGVASTLFAAAVRRYVDAHFEPRPASRFIAFVGDAELDEGNIWEAIFDGATANLASTMWVVDFNRQSLDRVVPGVRIDQWRGQFESSGWHVIEVKYGARLEECFARPGGELLRTWLDSMPNEHYQSLFALTGTGLRERFLEGAPIEVVEFVADFTDDREFENLVKDLGGHSLEAMLAAYRQCDAEAHRPSVVFAYTIKGWGLPTAGNPRNHSLLLSEEQVASLRSTVGLTMESEWDRFDSATPTGIWCDRRREALRRELRDPRLSISVPQETGARSSRAISTQEAFGRVLTDLSKNTEIARFLVTTAPDVATSTNLAGIINRLGVFEPQDRRSWSEDPVLRWSQGPAGQHIELGISEMNLFLLLGQLGMSWDHSSQPLIPIGTVYDPFVCRGLDALIYATYSGARFIVAGTPSGVTLAPEGGAHQSSITASIGLELPGITAIEPAFVGALDWLMCDAIGRIAEGTAADEGAYYLRLTTRPIDQAPFDRAKQRLGSAVLRRQVLQGAYLLHDASPTNEGESVQPEPQVILVASGAVMPEVLAASAELADEGILASVVDVTSGDRLYTSWQRTIRQGIRTAMTPSFPGELRSVFPTRLPIVTVHDAASHNMAWMGSALGVPCIPLGVDSFGHSATIGDLYAAHDLDSGSIVNAAIAALSLWTNRS